MTTVIRLENIAKKFTLTMTRSRSLQEAILGRFSRKRRNTSSSDKEAFWVLKDLNFEIYQGETFSIVGANGSGKSTLLKLITQIVKPTRGILTVNGRISALLELGAGFHPDLTGRENIYLSGTLTGLSRSEVEQNIQKIIDFASLGRFIDVPVSHYSSGMFVRLGFALATHISPDILIVDEVLAVGDVSFRKKCIEKIHTMRQQGTTVIFISHDMSVVRSISDRILWLKNGQIEAIGDPPEIIQMYLADQRKIQVEARVNDDEVIDLGKLAEIESVEFLNGTDQLVSTLETGRKSTIRINYLAHERIDNPVFGLAIHTGDGVHINGPNTAIANFEIDYIEGQGIVEYQINALPLLSGVYSVTVGIFDHTTSITYDHQVQASSFTVKQNESQEIYGLVYMPAQWHHIKNINK